MMESVSPNDIQDLIKRMGAGEKTNDILVFNPKTGKLERVSQLGRFDLSQKTDGAIEISAEEASMFIERSNDLYLIIKMKELKVLSDNCGIDENIEFRCSVDFSEGLVNLSQNGESFGRFYCFEGIDCHKSSQQGLLDLERNTSTVIIIVYHLHCQKYTAYLKEGDTITEIVTCILPEDDTGIYSRINGIYETSILSGKRVIIIGLGSGGSPIAIELVKQGVKNFILIDNDRLEIGNIARHICGLSDLGRYKTLAIKDMIMNKNPLAEVVTYESNVLEISLDNVKDIFSSSDIVICATDNQESKLFVNRVIVDLNKVCIFGGAFTRAYGGQVLRVIPKITMCYECFIRSLPTMAKDNEISSERQASNIQYSDKIVPIEPGLSTDILPISTLISKLAILELLRGEEHTLNDLYIDFSASFYIWFNRRETGSNWDSALVPLETNISSMSIMRWYGIDANRIDTCTTCGDSELCADTLSI